MDRNRLTDELAEQFSGSERACRAVSRQARDIADSGRFEDDFGAALTADTVVSNLADAPEEFSLVERWNWWIGSLDLSQGSYERFLVREDLEE